MGDYRDQEIQTSIDFTMESGEHLTATASLDLTLGRVFGRSLLALTNRRLIWIPDESSNEEAQLFRIDTITSLKMQDFGGLGTLEAVGESGLLGRWSCTQSKAQGVLDLIDAFSRQRDDLSTTIGEKEHSEEPLDSSVPEPMPRVSTLFRLLSFARPHVVWLTFSLILTLASTGAGLIPPLLTWPLLDDILTPYQEKIAAVNENTALTETERATNLQRIREKESVRFGNVPWYLLGMLGAALIAWILGWGQGWVIARLGERISADLRNTTYRHLNSLSLDYFTAKRTGDLVSRISSDTDRICFFLSDTLTDFSTDIIMITGTVVMLFYMDPVLALATLGTFPFVVWITVVVRARLRAGFLRSSRAWADMTSILADTIPGVRVVKAFAQEQREIERFVATNDRIVAANDRVNRLWTFFWPMVAMLNQIGLTVAWAFGIWRIYDQQITVGMLTAFLAYIVRFYARLESMSRMEGRTQRAAASAQRIFEVLDRTPSVPEPTNPVQPGRLKGKIELMDVGFRFGNRRVLDDVSLDIEPGEMIGVVGPTGAGKSTLVNLLCRFYEVSEGTIRVDGKDIRLFPVPDYRKNIGLVLQDPFLFFGTISENLAYGRPEATREEIIAAAKAAFAHEFILRLPDGYDSMVGERGQILSGGERQRISIARALLIDPRILILDEATSSVDSKTEVQIQQALDNLTKGRTTIAIAHRLSTIRHAGRIVVLDQGSIAEMGTHETLIAKGGLYRSLYEAQDKEEQERQSTSSSQILFERESERDEKVNT